MRHIPPFVLTVAAVTLLVLAGGGYGHDGTGSLQLLPTPRTGPGPLPTPTPTPPPAPTPTPARTVASHSDGEPVVFAAQRGSLLLGTLGVLAAASAMVWFLLVIGGVESRYAGRSYAIAQL